MDKPVSSTDDQTSRYLTIRLYELDAPSTGWRATIELAGQSLGSVVGSGSDALWAASDLIDKLRAHAVRTTIAVVTEPQAKP